MKLIHKGILMSPKMVEDINILAKAEGRSFSNMTVALLRKVLGPPKPAIETIQESMWVDRSLGGAAE